MCEDIYCELTVDLLKSSVIETREDLMDFFDSYNVKSLINKYYNCDNVPRLIDQLHLVKWGKQNGFFDDSWCDLLENDLIEKLLNHWHSQVRYETLALVIESKKITLPFTDKELQFIDQFVKRNLSDRTEFEALIKKALKRISASASAIERMAKSGEENVSIESVQGYNEFLISLRQTCLSVILPGMSYSRRKSALRILLHLQDTQLIGNFTRAIWAEAKIDCLLLAISFETYDSNKHMAYCIVENILKTSNFKSTYKNCSVIVGEDNESLKEFWKNNPKWHYVVYNPDRLFEKAVTLAKSVRTNDHVTAAILLKFLIKCLKYSPGSGVDSKDSSLRIVTCLLDDLKTHLRVEQGKTPTYTYFYGLIYCIRCLLQDCNLRIAALDIKWKSFAVELIQNCFVFIELVSPIANNSSPEGFVPENIAKNGKLNTRVPQIVLMSSWRTIKEISLLLGYLVSNSAIEEFEDSEYLLSASSVKEIGELFVTLLCEMKHRGAFEQAHVGFEQVCKRLWHCNEKQLKELPKIWLVKLLLVISYNAPANSALCATRRSAGVPFMIQALVSPEPTKNKEEAGETLNSLMKVLLGFCDIWEKYKKSTLEGQFIASEALELVKSQSVFAQLEPVLEIEGKCIERCEKNVEEFITHTLNILRALIKHSRIGELVKSYVADGFIVAIKSYNAKCHDSPDKTNWPERNAATLLYTALITRTFGVQRTKDYINLSSQNKMYGKIFFEKYPKLLPFLLETLEEYTATQDTLAKPGLLLILLILSRLYPNQTLCNANESTWKRDEFLCLISKCAKSPLYKTRDLAARTFAQLLPASEELQVKKKLLERFDVISDGLKGGRTFNELHGNMMQANQIIENTKVKEVLKNDEIYQLISKSWWIVESLKRSNNGTPCYPLATQLLKTVQLLSPGTDCLPDIVSMEAFVANNALKAGPGREIYEESAVKLHIDTRLKDKFDSCRLFSASYDNADVEIAIWSSLGKNEILKKLQNNNEMCHDLLAIALSKLKKSINDFRLMEAICSALYCLLSNVELDTKSIDNLIAIYDFLSDLFSHDDFYVRGSYLKLQAIILEHLYSHKNYDTNLSVKLDALLKYFVDYSWLGLTSDESKLEMAKGLQSLCQPIDTVNDIETSLNWWTAMLNFLVDDNVNIRLEASKALHQKCQIHLLISSTSITLDIFFNEFCKKFDANVARVTLFLWGIMIDTQTDDSDELDDNDVFNKSNNFENFEPDYLLIEILRKMAILKNDVQLNSVLPKSLFNWCLYHYKELKNLQSDKANARTIVESFTCDRNDIPQMECLESSYVQRYRRCNFIYVTKGLIGMQLNPIDGTDASLSLQDHLCNK